MWVCAAPARQSVAASRATKPRPSAPPSAICATPATQNGGRCEFVPRLPRKTTVDVSLCHACHAKWMSPSAAQLCVCDCVWLCVKLLYVKFVCVWSYCIWEMVCDKVVFVWVCVKLLYVKFVCVCVKGLYVQFVCVKIWYVTCVAVKLCERWYVTKLCLCECVRSYCMLSLCVCERIVCSICVCEVMVCDMCGGEIIDATQLCVCVRVCEITVC